MALEENTSQKCNCKNGVNCSSFYNSEKIYVIKLLRAAGGCLGINRRRRTC
jgi:hypothetical protein